MNPITHTAQTFADILFADKHTWETVVSIDDSDPIDIRFAQELVDLNGKVIALAVVMAEKPHTWFFDCSQTFTADIAPDGCEMTFSHNPWDATEGKQVQGKVMLARRLLQTNTDSWLCGGFAADEMEVYVASSHTPKSRLLAVTVDKQKA